MANFTADGSSLGTFAVIMRHVDVGPRRGAAFAAMLLLAAQSAPAMAAIAPWYPQNDDRCAVIANATPRFSSAPRSWFESVLDLFGWAGPDRRDYIIPAVVDCRGNTAAAATGWACHPNFIAWAKKRCAGVEYRE